MFKKRKNRIIKDFLKGFTILEALVSIAIFGIISVVLGNILLSVMAVSLSIDRRNEVLYEIMSITSNIQNEIRSADKVNICNNLNVLGLLIVKGSSLRFIFSHSNALWQLSSNSNNNVSCQDLARVNRDNGTRLHSSDIVVLDFAIKASSDGGKNALVYISFSVCDAESVKPAHRAFDCDRNPYKHLFAVATRSI